MSTQETIDETLRQFEIMVLELIQMGYSASRAVQIAYKHYPIMEVMESPLVAEMVQNFERGYHSVLVPNQGVIPYSTSSIGEAMKSAWTADGLTLSKRLHGRSKKVRRDVANTIDAAIKQGKNSIAMARDIFSGYGEDGLIPPAELPNYIDKVRKLKPPPYTDKKAVQEHKRILRSTERKIKQNSTPSLRAAYSELIEAVEKESAIAVSKAVTVATQEKARYHAERIARTENARAYADGQMLRYIDDDDVVALKWRLSSRHPVHDICDFWANADLYGLGKGIYPKDKFPIMPAHPHCFCLISPIYDFELDITKAKENIDEGAMKYLRSLNKREQERMLGIHGRTLVMSGKESWRNKLRGFNTSNFKVRKPKVDIGLFENINELVIPEAKITKYCLDKTHKSGGPKAVAFEKYLGYNLSNSKAFEAFLRNSTKGAEIIEKGTNEHGTRYELSKYVNTKYGYKVKLIMGWIVGSEKKPRLTTAYLKPEDKKE